MLALIIGLAALLALAPLAALLIRTRVLQQPRERYAPVRESRAQRRVRKSTELTDSEITQVISLPIADVLGGDPR